MNDKSIPIDWNKEQMHPFYHNGNYTYSNLTKLDKFFCVVDCVHFNRKLIVSKLTMDKNKVSIFLI